MALIFIVADPDPRHDEEMFVVIAAGFFMAQRYPQA